jgi:phosphopantetheinyl transferase
MSTSSTAEGVAIAIAHGSVGVDIVTKRDLDGLDARSMARHVPAVEIVQRAYAPTIGAPELWTAVEALSKTTSHGLTADEAEMREALAAHQLHWAHHPPDHVSCLAVSGPIEEFDIVDAELHAELTLVG